MEAAVPVIWMGGMFGIETSTHVVLVLGNSKWQGAGGKGLEAVSAYMKSSWRGPLGLGGRLHCGKHCQLEGRFF